MLFRSVRIDNWENPNPDAPVNKNILSAENPSAIIIPPGFANGFKNLQEKTQLIFFSSSSVDDSHGDDYRYNWNYWNPWGESYR